MLNNVLPGGWIVDGKLGEGSYGIVYRAKRSIGQQLEWAAIKHISIPSNDGELNAITAELGTDSEAEVKEYLSTIKDAVVAEYHQMKQFQGYTNIVACNDIQIVEKESTIGFDLYIRMELLSSLSSRIVSGKMDRKETIRMAMDICKALSLLSSKGIVHRDIKPQNVFVNENGDYKLGDFGTARSIQGTSTMMSMKGTYAYMAPEIMMGKPANFTADIYSLGLMMYRLMNGNKAPFMQPGQASTASSIEAANTRRFRGEELPLPAEADETLGKIICKACAYESWNRWQSAEEMYDALCDIAEGTVQRNPIYTPPVIPKHQDPPANQPAEPSLPPKKNKWWIAVLASVIILAGVIGYTFPHPIVDRSVPAAYVKAESLLAQGKDEEARRLFLLAVPYEDSLKRAYAIRRNKLSTDNIACGFGFTLGLKVDGTVIAAGNGNKCDVTNWTDIVAVAANDTTSYGLKSDGTVMETPYRGRVARWTDIVAISAGYNDHVVGLKSDGTVVAAGSSSSGECAVSHWKNVVAISAGMNFTVGLKADGTVLFTGSKDPGGNNDPTKMIDVSGWTDIVEIKAGGYHLLGIKSDGTVVATGDSEYIPGEGAWKMMKSISAGYSDSAGVTQNGTVVVVAPSHFVGAKYVNVWEDEDIVGVASGYNHVVVLKNDGTLHAVALHARNINDWGQCNVDRWDLTP